MEQEQLNESTNSVESDLGNEGSLEKDTLFESVLISVNCCVAGSIFGAPWGFAEAGWVLSLVLSVVALMAMISLGLIVLQVLSRMPYIHKYAKTGYKIVPVSILDFFKNYPPEHYIIKSNDQSENTIVLNPSSYAIQNIKYDFTIICKILLGKKLEKVLNFLIVANSLVFLIGCTSSFASSMTSLVPIGPLDTCNIFENPSFLYSCRYKYIFYIGIFSTIVSSMTLLWHFTDSKAYLLGVCIARIIVVIIMIATAVKAGITGTQLNSNEDIVSTVPFANFHAFGIGVPIIFLTMGFHLLIPDVEQPLKNKEKNSVKMLLYGFSTAFLIIVLLSLSMIYGCSEVETLATLNWKNYSNGGPVDGRPLWTAAIEMLVMIFPCVDITSIFAMTTVNTADNIIALHFDGLQDYCVEPERIFRTRVFILIVSIFVPMYFYDLGIVFAVAGAINIVFIFLFIIMFGIASKILIPEVGLYDNFLANKNFLRIFLVVSLIFCVKMWVNLINYLLVSNDIF